MATNEAKSIPQKNEENTILDIMDGIITSRRDESRVLMAAPSRKRFGAESEPKVLSQAATDSQKEEKTEKTDMATKEGETNKDLVKSGEKESEDSVEGVFKADQLPTRLLKAAPTRRRFGTPEQKPQPDLLQADSDQKSARKGS